MALSEARKRANKKWNDTNMKERYDEIKIRTPKGKKQLIQERAEELGISLNSYVNKAIDELMRTGGGYRISSADEGAENNSRLVSHTENVEENEPQ